MTGAIGVAVANLFLALSGAAAGVENWTYLATGATCLVLMAVRAGCLIAEWRAEAIPPPTGPEADYHDPADAH